MTLVSEIIRDAYRESNIIATGDVPDGDQSEEGLSALQRILASVYGHEAGELLNPVIIGKHNISRPQGYPWYDPVPDSTNWFVPPNSRLLLNLSAATTIYLDPNPQDGSRFAILDKSSNLATYNLTMVGNGRTIAGATQIVFSTDGDDQEYMYRADIGDWRKISPIDYGDAWPFPTEFDSLFIIMLAERVNPRYQQQIEGQSVAEYKRILGHFKARYRQNTMVGSELGLLFTPGARRGWFGGSQFGQSLFNSGIPFPFGFRMY